MKVITYILFLLSILFLLYFYDNSSTNYDTYKRTKFVSDSDSITQQEIQEEEEAEAEEEERQRHVRKWKNNHLDVDD